MKQAINTAITAVRRSAAWFAMRSIEANLAGFDPGLFRHGAAERWRQLSHVPATHSHA